MRKKSFKILNEDLDDFNAILICAVRYCIGRETYMPSLVQDFIMKYPDLILTSTKEVMLRDIAEADRVTKHPLPSGKELVIDHLGNTQIDRPGWLRFRDWLENLNTEEGDKV